MTQVRTQKDLVVLVADKNMEFAIKGLLSRSQSFGINPLTYDIHVHIERDPGCFLKGHDFMRPFQRSHCYALIIFDRQGCGREQMSRLLLEQEVEGRLDQSGWKDKKAAAIAIDPELENWVWSSSPHVDTVLGWKDRSPTLREWLARKNLFLETAAKPLNPKLAMEEALQAVGKPRSSSLYLQLTQRVSLEGCTDSAFLKFRQCLSSWFGVPNS
mgnify:CR=1 FL=1